MKGCFPREMGEDGRGGVFKRSDDWLLLKEEASCKLCV
jgi:hypothetical protein